MGKTSKVKWQIEKVGFFLTQRPTLIHLHLALKGSGFVRVLNLFVCAYQDLPHNIFSEPTVVAMDKVEGWEGLRDSLYEFTFFYPQTIQRP